MYIEYNPNPVGSNVGDCVVRAVSKALNESWENAYLKLCIMGFAMGDLPNNDNVYGAVLRMHGFKKRTLSDTCPDCYTVKDFAQDNPYGTFVLGLGGHVVTVEDGDIYDAFDSSSYVPIYYWYRASEERTNNRDDSESTNPNVLHSTYDELSAAPNGAAGNVSATSTAAPAAPAKPAESATKPAPADSKSAAK